MELRKLSMEEIDVVGGGYGRAWEFVSQNRINNEKFCNYVQISTGRNYSYSAGRSANAYCYPSRTTVTRNGNLITTSPSPGHVFQGGRNSPAPTWRDRWSDIFS